MAKPDLLDPVYRPLLEIFPSFELTDQSLTAVREQFDELTPVIEHDDPDIKVEEMFIPSHNENHQVRILVYRAATAEPNCPCVLEIHGGGHVVGSAEIGDIANRETAKTIAGVVIAVDYRLAPETRFPGPIEDCYSALLWLYQNAERNSVDKHRIGVIGTSAGGGLAAALCLMARDRAEVPVAFQGLFMPMLDSSTPARLEQNPKPHLGQHVWTNQNNRFAWQALLGFDPDSRDVSCYASPAQAEDLSNLPPTYISIGALDLFVEETLDYAKRMIAAGNEVDLHIYAGAPHAYNAIPDAEATQNEHLLLQKALARAFKL